MSMFFPAMKNAFLSPFWMPNWRDYPSWGAAAAGPPKLSVTDSPAGSSTHVTFQIYEARLMLPFRIGSSGRSWGKRRNAGFGKNMISRLSLILFGSLTKDELENFRVRDLQK